MNKSLLLIALITIFLFVSCKKNPTSSPTNTAPIASFTITPSSGGTTATTFTFDASGSSDNEDETSVLQVRWDWNNDGVWDTDYNTAKTATHQYTLEGTYTVVLEVMDSAGLTNTITKTVSLTNTAPTASFTVDPIYGTTATTFTFDASGSSDNEDETSVLKVRWDWENDGTYDTNYSTTKTATHQYSTVGTYTVKLEVKDNAGLTNTTTKTVSLTNTAPTASFTVDPTSGTTATTFTFDASGSTDNEDEASSLEVRWDWENDGTYDTNYSTTKTATHQYTLEGTYTVKLEVMDSAGWINNTTKIVTVPTVVTFSDANFEALVRVTLNKQGGDITDIELEDITQLNGSSWNISDISGIEYCINIQNLDLRDNQIIDISPLSGLVYLQTLTLLRNQLIDISALSGLLNLKVLGLSENQIIDIGSLEGLTNLNLLYLGNNQIISIISLSALINLKELGLADNQIVDISAISGLVNLGWFDLDNNQIVDISALSSLINLSWIEISDNLIVDINPFVQNGGIDNGDTINILRNPLSETSINTYIPQLEARGVTVNY